MKKPKAKVGFEYRLEPACVICANQSEFVDADRVIKDKTGNWYTAIYYCPGCQQYFRVQWEYPTKKVTPAQFKKENE